MGKWIFDPRDAGRTGRGSFQRSERTAGEFLDFYLKVFVLTCARSGQCGRKMRVEMAELRAAFMHAAAHDLQTMDPPAPIPV